ncbi:hypothetical protein C3B53_00790 [Citrobacter sp. SL156]|nr:hypothetical protein C3B53_00790 [Citrobacter sp. SL156]
MVILVGLAIDQIAQSGLSSLSVIYYSAQLFRRCWRDSNYLPDHELPDIFLHRCLRVNACAGRHIIYCPACI